MIFESYVLTVHQVTGNSENKLHVIRLLIKWVHSDHYTVRLQVSAKDKSPRC